MSYKKITKTVEYSAKELFAIVADIEKYGLFLPHCEGVRIISQSTDTISAQMFINYKTRFKNFQVSYVSNVELLKEHFTINITNAEKGLFKALNSSWNFRPKVGGCVVEYEISFVLQNPLLNIILSGLFINQCEEMVQAFLQRAKFLRNSK